MESETFIGVGLFGLSGLNGKLLLLGTTMLVVGSKILGSCDVCGSIEPDRSRSCPKVRTFELGISNLPRRHARVTVRGSRQNLLLPLITVSWSRSAYHIFRRGIGVDGKVMFASMVRAMELYQLKTISNGLQSRGRLVYNCKVSFNRAPSLRR